MLTQSSAASHRLRHRLVRTGLVLAFGALAVTGCRSDSLSGPPPTNCPGGEGCRTSPAVSVDASVFSALSDASVRLVPSLPDAAARTAVANALSTLSHDLQAGQDADARVALAQVYSALLPFRVTLGAGVTGYPPDVAALRLDLIPTANALGVDTQ